MLDVGNWWFDNITMRRWELAQKVFGQERLNHDCICDPPVHLDFRNFVAGMIMTKLWYHKDKGERCEHSAIH